MKVMALELISFKWLTEKLSDVKKDQQYILLHCEKISDVTNRD
jgi:hypothetical protein